MAQPLANKLAGKEAEVLKDIQMFGDQYAMEKYLVKDFVAWRRWVFEQTHDPEFGRHPQISFSGNRDVGEQIVDALVGYVLRNETEKQNLKQRISYLEMQLNQRKPFNQQKVASLLEAVHAATTG